MNSFGSISSIVTAVVFIVGFILSLVGLLIVPRNRKPSAGMAWLLVIFILPYIGWILFLLLGTDKLPQRRRNSQVVLDTLIDKRVLEMRHHMVDAVPQKYRSIALLATSMGHLPPLSGYVSSYLTDYHTTIDTLVDDLNNAHTSIYFEYFILTLDQTTQKVFDALANAVKRGVEVRVLYDWWSSSKYPSYRKTVHYLKDNAISFRPMLKFTFSFKNYLRPDLRNHRKIAIIDQQIGYIGSQNMIRRNYGRRDDIVYNELVVRLTGAVVHELSVIFAYDWSVETDERLHHVLSTELLEIPESNTSLLQILPSGPSYNDENNLKVFTLAINRAETDVFIANPYFVPSEPLLSAIETAVKRGVRVRMINSQAMDQWMVGHAQRSYYESLLQVGVEVYLYKKPILLHSKFIIIDDELGIVGSSNLDIRSFELDQEISLLIYNQHDMARLGVVRDEYLENSRIIHLESWRKRKLPKQLLDSIARLTSNIQ